MKALYVSLLLLTSAFLCAAQNSNLQPKIEDLGELKFATAPDVPACFTSALAYGDPNSGPSTFVVKGAKGCEIPMHYHTPTEQVVMVGGKGRMEMKGSPPRVIRAGAFAITPPRHPHRFACETACQFYIISDGVFDIHYVDEGGNEIPFEKAVKPVAKAAASQY